MRPVRSTETDGMTDAPAASAPDDELIESQPLPEVYEIAADQLSVVPVAPELVIVRVCAGVDGLEEGASYPLKTILTGDLKMAGLSWMWFAFAAVPVTGPTGAVVMSELASDQVNVSP